MSATQIALTRKAWTQMTFHLLIGLDCIPDYHDVLRLMIRICHLLLSALPVMTAPSLIPACFFKPNYALPMVGFV